MVKGKSAWQLDQFKAHRMAGLWQTANVVAMVHNTTRSEASECKAPKVFFDQMQGVGPPVEDDDDCDDGGSLAKVKAERREREERERREKQNGGE